MNILVINCGSSSIKFRLFNMHSETTVVSGSVERIGEQQSSIYFLLHTSTPERTNKYEEQIAGHDIALSKIFALLNRHSMFESGQSPDAIGHRVVHGGEHFQAPVLISEFVIEEIHQTIPLAPLHNPANLTGIKAGRRLYPKLPQVAVFDTAFHQTLPAHSYRYALPDDLYQKHHIRRYGFHGTSHQFVVKEAADFLQQPLASLKLISLHLGNGASIAAVDGGKCIDTSMGMTPLEGLIMGTRSGDLDPSIIFYLAREHGMDLAEIETLLNRDSGLKGICGENDMREVHLLADNGDVQAQLALDMFCYRIRKYIGAYFVALGGLDALIFTAGIGEYDARVRQAVCDGLATIGVSLDNHKNSHASDETYDIASDQSSVSILVIHTNEELEIARQTLVTL